MVVGTWLLVKLGVVMVVVMVEIEIEIGINLLFELQYNYIGNTEYKTKGRVLKVPRPPLNKITFYGL